MRRPLRLLWPLLVIAVIASAWTMETAEEKLFRHLVLHRLGDVIEARVDEVSGPYAIQALSEGGEGACEDAIRYIGEGRFVVDGEFRRSVVPFAHIVLGEKGFLGGGYGIQRPRPYEPQGCYPRA